MSQSANQMKMKINKACDLNSITVLPPHARRSNALSQGSQIRSQSQQSFSQGMSLSQSQLSQSSFDENLMNEQRFDSQERDKSLKRISSLASGTAVRDESQLQLARTSNSVIRRWGSASVPENRCQVSDELENRFRHVESSLSRLGMILDSVQSDVMQVNRAVKEVSMGTEGVRQKILLLDSSMGHVIKEEEGLKAFLDTKLKSIPEQILESDQRKLNEISSTILSLPKQIESHLLKFQDEVSLFVAEKMKEIVNDKKSSNNSYLDALQSPKTNCCPATQQPQKSQMPIISLPSFGHTKRAPVSRIVEDTLKGAKPMFTGSSGTITLKQEEISLPTKKKSCGADRQPQKSQMPISPLPMFRHAKTASVSRIKANSPKALKPKFTGSDRSIMLQQEESMRPAKEQDFRVIIDSDEESDGGLSCLLVKKETGQANHLREEAKVETLRIIRKARKRKIKQSNCVILD